MSTVVRESRVKKLKTALYRAHWYRNGIGKWKHPRFGGRTFTLKEAAILAKAIHSSQGPSSFTGIKQDVPKVIYSEAELRRRAKQLAWDKSHFRKRGIKGV